MKKPKSIFLLIYLIFHIALLVISIYVNYRSEDFEFLLYLREKMSMMVYVSAIGLVLFFINVMISGLDGRSHTKEKETLEQEVNALKAKMFDLQEATNKPKETPAPSNSDQSASDESTEESKS